MKRIIITGGSQGLGFELSKLFLEKGYEVICLSRNKPNLGVIHIVTDLSNEESIFNTISLIKKEYNDFSCFINCAVVGGIEKFGEFDFKNSKEMFDVNIFGPSILVSGLLSIIKNNESDIIYIGATIGYKPDLFMPIYSITKWGLRGLIENLRLELKNTKCRVIGIHSGGLDTESNIGAKGRGTIISEMTGNKIGSLMKTKDIANFIYQTINTPKNIEVSEVIINRK